MSNPYLDRYVENPLVGHNAFKTARPQDDPLPTFAASRALLPEPSWAGHDDAIACYWKTWELAFRSLRRPTAANGFVANYIDTAFNDHLFMWDSVFILMFGRYGRRAFDFQRTLDNLYCKQHVDGFISRQIVEADGRDFFHRHDPVSTGPNVLAWSEWEYFLNFADHDRLSAVLPVLMAYHQWLRVYRTWPDGTYWTSGWACGMDNQPRVCEGYHPGYSHGHVSWIDACLQMIFSAKVIVKIADALGRGDEVADFRREADELSKFVNSHMWDDRTSFYCDRRRDGTISPVKSIGAYWALLADIVPAQRLAGFLAHLDDEREFNRPHRCPSLSADHPLYDPAGGYWLGAVWPPTNYMLLRGLTHVGHDGLAHEIATNHLGNVVDVFNRTGTLWENYAPEATAPGKPAKGDFVGWGGVGPVAVMFEYVFGLRSEAQNARLVWDVRLTDAHGVRRYPFGRDGLLDLSCAARKSASDEPAIQAKSNIPITLEIRWPGGKKTISLRP